jgi:putative membrane protein
VIAFWGLGIWAIATLFRRPADRWPGDGRRERPDPERILAERFARDEINEAEYHRRLQTLRSANGQPADPSR